MKPLSQLPPDGGARSHLLGPAKGDGKLTFDKLTDLYHSGTNTKRISRPISSFTIRTSAMSAA